MVEPLDQSEIDDLLNSTDDFDDPEIDDLGADELDENIPRRKITNFRTPWRKTAKNRTGSNPDINPRLSKATTTS